MESLFAKEMEDFLPFSTSGFLCPAFYSIMSGGLLKRQCACQDAKRVSFKDL